MHRTDFLPQTTLAFPANLLAPDADQSSGPLPVNARGPIDTFITRDPTPLTASRRSWRRRRVLRGKS